MAECDCTHEACESRGYCMAARIAELEAERNEYMRKLVESDAALLVCVEKYVLFREAVIEAMDMDCAAATWTILRDALATLDKGKK